ncbi:MAG: DUF1549 domain-containing protein, partial [Planctomycetota bacterium]
MTNLWRTETGHFGRRSTGICCAAYGVTILVLASTGSAADSDFFERKIRPVLVQHCYECHSEQADVVQGGLRLDQPGSMARGGDSGALIVPGKPEASLLVSSLRYDDLEMPPEGQLDQRIVDDFETWIRHGAVDPRSKASNSEPTKKQATIDWTLARQHWSFQEPLESRSPHSVGGERALDGFIRHRLDQEGLEPNPSADPAVLVRRVSFDLTGLPPSADEAKCFANDEHPLAYRRLVDRRLATPAHAEHWTRLWLDIARYAEDQAHKVGNNDSLTYPNAYRYRDWVIDAFAADMPYDQFVRLQLAADHYQPEDIEAHVALGFLGLGPKYYRRSSPEVMADEWEDRVDTVSRGLLGLTVACARCHDHKYDPIPTSDYYALAGVFASTKMYNRPLDDSVEVKDGEAKQPVDALHIVRDGNVTDLHVMIRGDVNRKGELAPRRFLSVLREPDESSWTQGSGRNQLADSIVDERKPLTP